MSDFLNLKRYAVFKAPIRAATDCPVESGSGGSQSPPMLSQTDPKLSQTDGNLSKTDHKLSKTDPKLSKTDTKLSKIDPKLSQTQEIMDEDLGDTWSQNNTSPGPGDSNKSQCYKQSGLGGQTEDGRSSSNEHDEFGSFWAGDHNYNNNGKESNSNNSQFLLQQQAPPINADPSMGSDIGFSHNAASGTNEEQTSTERGHVIPGK